MQCLSSPTRSEIDKAHGQGIWLDIGVPSIRNLRRLSTTRIVLWWLLAISSIPLHLLYNSAVFSTLCTHRYNAFLVTSDFLNGAPFNVSSLYARENGPFPRILLDTLQDTLQGYQNNQTSFAKIENKNCVEIYTAPIISSYSDVLLISSGLKASDLTVANSLLWSGPDVESSLIKEEVPGTIFCEVPVLTCIDGNDIDPRNLSFNASDVLYYDTVDHVNGTITGLPFIDYCLSKRAGEDCKLQFSLTIMVVVIICNLIKTICMSIIVWKQDPEPLVTLGDAIASFLDRPDVSTEGNCAAGKTRFEDSRSWGPLLSGWGLKQLRWFRSASRRRWLASNIL